MPANRDLDARGFEPEPGCFVHGRRRHVTRAHLRSFRKAAVPDRQPRTFASNFGASYELVNGTLSGAVVLQSWCQARLGRSMAQLMPKEWDRAVEPVTVTIVSALAAGAAAAAKDVATDTIKDAYAGLKRLITDRYERVAPFASAVETDPASEPEQKVLAKQLDQAGAGQDEALKAAAQTLLDALESLRSDPRAAAMFDLGRLRAARNFELEDIQAAGPVLRADEADIGGDFKARGVRQVPAGRSAQKN